jgi:cytochrome b561
MVDTTVRRAAALVAPAAAYTLAARVLHWITAVLVLTMIPLGFLIANIEDLPRLYDFHRSIGVLLLLIVSIRLAYRVTHPPLPLPADIPLVQRLVAALVHWTLYGVLIVQPILGWIATSAYPAPITVFWVFTLPPIWREDRALFGARRARHRACAGHQRACRRRLVPPLHPQGSGANANALRLIRHLQARASLSWWRQDAHGSWFGSHEPLARLR